MDEHLSTLHKLSRIIIFVPLIIVVLAVYIKYTTPDRSAQNTRPVSSITPEPEEESALLSMFKTGTDEASIDINGSYTCRYNANNKSISAAIKKKNVFVEYSVNNATSSALINGDCAYQWKKGAFTGKKMCGVSQFITIYESLSSVPFIGSQPIFSMLEAVNPDVKIAPEELNAISKSCLPTEVNDSNFTIPSHITFEDRGTFTFTEGQ